MLSKQLIDSSLYVWLLDFHQLLFICSLYFLILQWGEKKKKQPTRQTKPTLKQFFFPVSSNCSLIIVGLFFFSFFLSFRLNQELTPVSSLASSSLPERGRVERKDNLPNFYDLCYIYSGRMSRSMKQGVSTNFTRINVCITDNAEGESHGIIRSKTDQKRVWLQRG